MTWLAPVIHQPTPVIPRPTPPVIPRPTPPVIPRPTPPVIPRLVRGTYRGTMLVEVARTSRAMTKKRGFGAAATPSPAEVPV
jgi:hypothetical protein